MHIGNRLNELMHIVNITVDTALTSRLPKKELSRFISSKLFLVLVILSQEIIPYDAGAMAPQWVSWGIYALDYMRKNAKNNFGDTLCHVIHGYQQILIGNVKFTNSNHHVAGRGHDAAAATATPLTAATSAAPLSH